METNTNIKETIKKKILEIFDTENRAMNIRELTQILRKRYKITKSEPFIKRCLDELTQNGELSLED
jgi:hypothetical protein